VNSLSLCGITVNLKGIKINMVRYFCLGITFL